MTAQITARLADGHRPISSSVFCFAKLGNTIEVESFAVQGNEEEMNVFRRTKRDSPSGLAAEAEKRARSGRVAEALETYEKALAAHREAGDHQAAAALGYDVGYGLYAAQDYERASLFLENAIRDYYKASRQPSKDGVPHGVFAQCALDNANECRYWLGCSQANAGDYPKAIANLRRAALCFQVNHFEKRSGDSFLMWGAALRDYGLDTNRERLLRMALSKFDAARDMFAQAESWREGDAGVGLGQCYLSSAAVYGALGDHDAVIAGYPEAKRVFQERGDAQQRRWCEETYQAALRAKREA